MESTKLSLFDNYRMLVLPLVVIFPYVPSQHLTEYAILLQDNCTAFTHSIRLVRLSQLIVVNW